MLILILLVCLPDHPATCVSNDAADYAHLRNWILDMSQDIGSSLISLMDGDYLAESLHWMEPLAVDFTHDNGMQG
jgi:hypothetical protein